MARAAAMVPRNRTGAALAPDRIDAMIAATEEFPPSSGGNGHGLAAMRIAYAKGGEPIGSMPPPPSAKSMATSALKAVQGKHPMLFLDKLAERLSFERAGTRLYEAVLSKYDAYGSFAGGPSREDIAHILAEEHAHFRMLSECIEQLGADPTAVTPSANVHDALGMGIRNVAVEPRTDFIQTLEAALVAELADNDGWEALVELAENGGEEDIAARCAKALSEEREHLQNVRTWLAAAQGRSNVPSERPRLPAPRRSSSARPRRPARVRPARTQRGKRTTSHRRKK